MSETSIYFFKKRANDKFKIYKLTVSKNEDLLEKTITEGQLELDNLEGVEYLQKFDRTFYQQVNYTLSKKDVSKKANELVTALLTQNTQIENIDDRYNTARSKDIYPFDGIAILQKNEDGSFKIGIEKLSEKLKLYKKEVWVIRIAKDYKVEPADSLFLIPKKMSIIIEGEWDAQQATAKRIQCIKHSIAFFEKMFDYREHWGERANDQRNQQKYLTITDEAWEEYSSDIRNVKKFVRFHSEDSEKEIQKKLNLVKQAYEKENVRDQVGFEFNVSEDGTITVEVKSQEQMKNFMAAIQRQLYQDIIDTSIIVRSEHSEKVNKE